MLNQYRHLITPPQIPSLEFFYPFITPYSCIGLPRSKSRCRSRALILPRCKSKGLILRPFTPHPPPPPIPLLLPRFTPPLTHTLASFYPPLPPYSCVVLPPIRALLLQRCIVLYPPLPSENVLPPITHYSRIVFPHQPPTFISFYYPYPLLLHYFIPLPQTITPPLPPPLLRHLTPPPPPLHD